MKNTRRFNEFMVLLSEKFDKEISPAMVKMIRKAVEPYQDEQCIRALESVILHGKYYSNLLPDLMEKLEESNEDKGLLAWSAFLTELKNYNGVSLQFSDPAIHSIVEAMGGMETLSMTEDKELKWVRKEFLDIYKSCNNRPDHPPLITGRHDEHNAVMGFRAFVQKPKFIPVNGQNVKQIEEGRHEEK